MAKYNVLSDLVSYFARYMISLWCKKLPSWHQATHAHCEIKYGKGNSSVYHKVWNQQISIELAPKLAWRMKSFFKRFVFWLYFYNEILRWKVVDFFHSFPSWKITIYQTTFHVKIFLLELLFHHTLNGFRNFDTECKDGADTLKLNFILGVAPFSFLCHSTLHFLQWTKLSPQL